MCFYDPRCLAEKKKNLPHWTGTVMCKGTDGFIQVLWPFAKNKNKNKNKTPNFSFIGLEYSNSHSDPKKTP